MWVFTVLSPSVSRSAISAFESPFRPAHGDDGGHRTELAAIATSRLDATNGHTPSESSAGARGPARYAWTRQQCQLIGVAVALLLPVSLGIHRACSGHRVTDSGWPLVPCSC